MKFNKKKLLTFVLPLILGVALVTGALLTYFGQVNAEITVTQPISVTVGGVDYTGKVFTDNLDVMAGEEIKGTTIEISNSADTPRKVVISEVNNVGGIEADYGIILCVTHLTDGSLGVEYDAEVIGVNPGTQILIPAGGSCWFSISYDTDDMLESGTYTVKTRIDSE